MTHDLQGGDLYTNEKITIKLMFYSPMSLRVFEEITKGATYETLSMEREFGV